MLIRASIAGSGTTAVALRAILYYLCRNPNVCEKLRAEISSAQAAGKISTPITYTESSKLPYLAAVINETLRIHSSTGFILERIVPKGGANISDMYIPEGTVVGINTWGMQLFLLHFDITASSPVKHAVLHQNKNIFGQDASAYRPERWIDSSPDQLKEMKRCMIVVCNLHAPHGPIPFAYYTILS